MGETQTHGQKDKKIDVDAQGLTSEGWHRLYVSRKKGGRRLTSTEGCMDASIWGPKVYIKKSWERVITSTSNSTDNISTNRTTQKLGNGKGNKNNCMDISSIKLETSNTRRPRHGYKRKQSARIRISSHSSTKQNHKRQLY